MLPGHIAVFEIRLLFSVTHHVFYEHKCLSGYTLLCSLTVTSFFLNKNGGVKSP